IFLSFFIAGYAASQLRHTFPTRRSSDPNGSQDRALSADAVVFPGRITVVKQANPEGPTPFPFTASPALPGPVTSFSLVDDGSPRSEEHTSELQSRFDLVCRLLLEKNKID